MASVSTHGCLVLCSKKEVCLKQTGHQWLTPVILATQEGEIRRIAVKSQPRQIVLKTLSQKHTSQKMGGCLIPPPFIGVQSFRLFQNYIFFSGLFWSNFSSAQHQWSPRKRLTQP
jgi:hypothetical protein